MERLDMKKRIDEIAEVRTGYQFREKVEPDAAGTHWVVQIKDVDAGRGHRLNVDDLWKVKPPRDPAGDVLQEGDVLYLAKGRRNYATRVEHLPHGAAIAAAYFFVLRPRTGDVCPDYLAWWINQPSAQKHLAQYFRGTNMPFIRMDDVASLEVPIPPLDVQRQIVKLYELSLRESALLRKLEAKRTELIRGLCLAAARRNGPNKE
jgi:hypothetical protein